MNNLGEAVTRCALLSLPGSDPLPHEPQNGLFEETVRQYEELVKERF